MSSRLNSWRTESHIESLKSSRESEDGYKTDQYKMKLNIRKNSSYIYLYQNNISMGYFIRKDSRIFQTISRSNLWIYFCSMFFCFSLGEKHCKYFFLVVQCSHPFWSFTKCRELKWPVKADEHFFSTGVHCGHYLKCGCSDDWMLEHM